MTNQRKIELLDRVIAHFEKQGKRAESSDGMCLYRGEGGMKCAVGCLIADENYSSELENKYANEPEVIGALAKSGVETDSGTIEFLRELQRMHDRAWGFDSLMEHYREMRRGLETP